MVKFGVDELQFEDDEKARFGDNDDYDLEYSSANDRAELTHAPTGTSSTAYIPRGRGGDLVAGRLGETVADGKALADDGNTYDSIQNAVEAADSYVKVGEGKFEEDVVIQKSGFTLVGSGNNTVIRGGFDQKATITPDASNVTIKSLSVRSTHWGIRPTSNGDGAVIDNVHIIKAESSGIATYDGNSHRNDWIITNCLVENTNKGIDGIGHNGICCNNRVKNTDGGPGIPIFGNSAICANNYVSGTYEEGIKVGAHDALVIGNKVKDVNDYGISIWYDDTIIANNHLLNTEGLRDDGTGTVRDANMVN